MTKTILVTGASTGFGRIAVEMLADQGHTVYAGMRDIQGRNAENRASLEARGQENLRVVELDVTDTASIAAAVAKIDAEQGRLDALVNNAGIFYGGPFEAFAKEQTDWVIATNFTGLMDMTRAVLPLMRLQGSGHLIHISSGVGRLAFPGVASYVASKFAVEGFAEALSLELEPLGITTTIIEPGAFPTPLFGKETVPGNAGVMEAYGHVGEMMAGFQETVQKFFESPEGNRPEEVSQAIVDSIAASPADRPLRLVVGRDITMVAELNAQAAEHQEAVLVGFGFKKD